MRSFPALAALAAAGLAVSSTALADVVTSWNQISLDTIVAVPTPPPRASRNLAMVHAAIYDAVNAIDGTHNPYLQNFGPAAGASRDAAAICAANSVLRALYPTQQANLDTLRTNQLNALPNDAARAAGISLGDTVGAAMLAARSTDHASDPQSYVPSGLPGGWHVGPDNGAAALLPQWGNVTPFTMTTGSQFRPPAPPALNTATYAASVNQVRLIGAQNSGTRTPEQTDIARAWAFGGGTITPPGAWNRIAQEIATDNGNSVSENARLFAMINTGMADAAIACWDAKYFYDLWRPIHAIREADIDGNPDTEQDPNWLPLLTPTPPFPTYTSGHSTFSRTAAEILFALLGTDNIDVTLNGDFGVNRQLTSLNDAANEAGLSRIYGGIHFDFDNIEAQICARQIAQRLLGNYFLPVPTPGSAAILGLAAVFAARRRRN